MLFYEVLVIKEPDFNQTITFKVLWDLEYRKTTKPH